MPQLLYGVWDNVTYDRRGVKLVENSGFIPPCSHVIAAKRISRLIRRANLLDEDDICRREQKPRVKLNELEPAQRDHNSRKVELGMAQEEAWQEAGRCMRRYRIMTVVTLFSIPGTNA